MRPTEIQERSPHQRTPDFLYPMITTRGASLINASPLLNPKIKSTFPRSQRWEYIRDISERTTPQNGPGRNKFKYTTNPGVGPKLLQTSFVEGGQNPNDYYYAGNLLCRKKTSQSPLHEQRSLPRINETFNGLDRHMRSRIFLRDASGNASTRTLNKSELGRANPRHTRSSSLYIEEAPTDVRELLDRVNNLKAKDTISVEELNKRLHIVSRDRSPARSESQSSPVNSNRKFSSSPIKQFSDYHTNYSFVVPTIQERGELSTPAEKERKEYYLTAHHRVLERAKRRIRPRVYVESHKKNNSFSNGLYIRTPVNME